jgi:hydroxycarboxylate dehydrogenase B
MRYSHESLRGVARAIFSKAGSSAEEASAIAEHLVDSNLAGHDSHGVIRLKKYIDWASAGMVSFNRHARVVQSAGPIMVIDGEFGFGQVIGREAIALGVDLAKRDGIAVLAIRNSAHLGRIGAWAEQAVQAGLVSVHFVNTSGFGILVAPHGGSDRRLSANPIAAGVPVPNAPPLILDMSTCVIAEGKIAVARNKGDKLDENRILDAHGKPTRDPEVFYANPPGAILPLGGHKGSGLSIFCEVLAGALTGGGSSHPSNPTANKLVNNMLSILIAPGKFTSSDAFGSDIERLVAWVRASPPITSGGEVLLPGEPERRNRADRMAKGIPLDPNTLGQLGEAAQAVGMAKPDFDAMRV